MTLLVDRPGRTIIGLIVPYGRAGRTGGRGYRFAPGSLTFPARLWLLEGHNWACRLGRAVRVEETPDGPMGVFRVVPGPAGDRALVLAARAGLSPGVNLADVGLEPGSPGVHVVRSAICTEVSLTESPAFVLPGA